LKAFLAFRLNRQILAKPLGQNPPLGGTYGKPVTSSGGCKRFGLLKKRESTEITYKTFVESSFLGFKNDDSIRIKRILCFFVNFPLDKPIVQVYYSEHGFN